MNHEAIIELLTPPLPYYLGAGRSDFRLGEQHPNRRNLGIYDLLIVAKGELHIGENGQQWALSEGDTLLLLPNGEHYSVKACERETSFYWVHFEHANRPAGVSLAHDAGLNYSSRPFGNPHVLRIRKHARLSNPESAFGLVRQLLALPVGDSFWEEQHLLAGLLAMLMTGGTDAAESPSSRLAERAAAYLQQNYRMDITNESLAAALHFHPNHIVRCMKSRYGRTPIHYLHDFRLERAKRLLISTDWSIDRIAGEVGFRYAPYFSACFKRGVGLSPLRFRKQYWH